MIKTGTHTKFYRKLDFLNTLVAFISIEPLAKCIEEIAFAIITVLKAPTVGDGGYPEVFGFKE